MIKATLSYAVIVHNKMRIRLSKATTEPYRPIANFNFSHSLYKDYTTPKRFCQSPISLGCWTEICAICDFYATYSHIHASMHNYAENVHTHPKYHLIPIMPRISCINRPYVQNTPFIIGSNRPFFTKGVAKWIDLGYNICCAIENPVLWHPLSKEYPYEFSIQCKGSVPDLPFPALSEN